MKKSIIAGLLVLMMSVGAWAVDFSLTGSEHLDVMSDYFLGNTYDSSSASILANGRVEYGYVYDNSSLSFVGGSSFYLEVFQHGSVDFSGGYIDYAGAHDYGSITVSGGSVYQFAMMDDSHLDISGGSVNRVLARGESITTIDGYDFELGSGLSWDVDGKTILGTGNLSGKWLGSDEVWTISIITHEAGATVQAVPEPGMMGLVAIGGMVLRRRK